MTVELWMGSDFDTSHEREALISFWKDMKDHYGASEVPYLILASYHLGGNEIDLTVLKPDAIVVIELKSCDVPFEASADGPCWPCMLDGRPVGGRQENPFKQAVRCEHAWINHL